MKVLSFIFAAFGAFLKSLFCKSDQERLGIAEERLNEYQQCNRVKKAMGDAPKISTVKELTDKLKNGSLAFLVAIFFMLLRVPDPGIRLPVRQRLD